MARRKKVEETPIIENIVESSLDELMGDRFGIYAKDVIQDRAIPDARDGLKPVQRRIVYDMWNTGNTFDKPTKKSAHIVGDVMGKYHPHGDASIYDALAHLSQDWRLRYPLVQFQGNNGSMDGDSPAAPRYTEARLQSISNELVADLEMNTVDMSLTYDDSQLEPSVLPGRFPNLLSNGSSGIAVGIATEIPPHNLGEICDAIIYKIRHPNCTLERLMKIIPGPDFPTGGIVHNCPGLKKMYKTGRGKISVMGRTEVVDAKNKKQIIITEIPYGVVKSQLVLQIDKIRHNKTVAGIEEVRDETDKHGLRIAIDLSNDANTEIILKYLMNKTNLMTNYSANMVAIVDGRPMRLDLISYCDCYIEHQIDVITRRSNYLYNKKQKRLEIVEGLIKAVSILDKVVEVIKKSKDKKDSKVNISNKFGFTMDQAEAIVMMPLYKLSHTDVQTLEDERDELIKDINNLTALLNDQTLIEKLIISDLKNITRKYGDARRTTIKEEELQDLSVDKRDLIVEEDVYVTITRDGYLKRTSTRSYTASGGGNGTRTGMKPGDSLVLESLCTTKDFLLAFTSKGNYFYIPVNELPDIKWNDVGGHASSKVNIKAGDKIIKAFIVRKFRNDLCLVLLSYKDQIKRINLGELPVKRRNRTIKCMNISSKDRVVDVVLTSGNDTLMVISSKGLMSCYNENEIGVTAPKSGGIKAGSFKGDPTRCVLAFNPGENDKFFILTDRGHTRIIDSSKYEVNARLNKPVELYSMFKKEPHILLLAERIKNKEAPYDIAAILNDKDDIDINIDSFNLTPSEKYAKKDPSFKEKDKITCVSRNDHQIIDENIKSFELPKEEDDEEDENFEQINLFDDGE